MTLLFTSLLILCTSLDGFIPAEEYEIALDEEVDSHLSSSDLDTPIFLYLHESDEPFTIVLESAEIQPRIHVEQRGTSTKLSSGMGAYTFERRVVVSGTEGQEYAIRIEADGGASGDFRLVVKEGSLPLVDSLVLLNRCELAVERFRSIHPRNHENSERVSLSLAISRRARALEIGSKEELVRSLEDFEEALETLESKKSDGLFFVKTVGEYSRTLLHLDRVEEARALLAESHKDIVDPEGVGLESAIALDIALGDLEISRGSVQSACILLEKAWRDCNVRFGSAHSLSISASLSLAVAWAKDGHRLSDARDLLEKTRSSISMEMYEQGEAQSACVCELHLSNVLIGLGQFKDSEACSERAMKIARTKLGLHSIEEASAYVQRGTSKYLQGRYDEALADLQEGRRIHVRLGGPLSPYVLRARSTIGVILGAKRNLEGARIELEDVLKLIEERDGPTSATSRKARESLIPLLFIMGKSKEALALHERSYQECMKEFGKAHLETLSAARQWAFALEHYDPARALELRRDVVDTGQVFLETQLKRLSEAERLRFSALHQLDIGCYLSSALRSGEDPRATYGRVLLWKGLVKRGLRSQRKALRLQEDEEIRETREQLLNVINKMEQADEREEIFALNQQRATLERDLYSRVGELSCLAPSPEDVQSTLLEKDVLFDVFAYNHSGVLEPGSRETSTEARIAIFVLTPDSEVRRVELGNSEEISRAIIIHRRGLQRQIPGSKSSESLGIRKSAERVRRLVHDPLVSFLNGKERLVVVPDGEVSHLSWASLEVEEGTYLIERMEIVYRTSACDLDGDHEDSERGDVIVLGDVDYGFTPASVSPEEDSVRASYPSFAPLVETKHEVSALVSLFSSMKGTLHELSRSKATVENLRTLVHKARYVHLATHGFYHGRALSSSARFAIAQGDLPPDSRVAAPGEWDMGQDLTSGLALCGANHPGEQGLLTSAEVSWLDLDGCDLVTLSACESGLGIHQSGEGLFGLRSALYLAGAHSIVCSMWKIPDSTTRDLMTSFYKNLWSLGQSKGEALRNAQLEILGDQRRRFGEAYPGTWGAFILEGHSN